MPRPLQAFDPVTQTLVTGQRDATTVPTQALFLMNSSFVRGQSLALAEKLFSRKAPGIDSQIRQAFQLIIGRLPNARELARSRRFLSEFELAYRDSNPAETAAVPLKLVPARHRSFPWIRTMSGFRRQSPKKSFNPKHQGCSLDELGAGTVCLG